MNTEQRGKRLREPEGTSGMVEVRWFPAREKTKNEERAGRRLPRPRPCSVLRRRARESGLYLTPNQLRSAVPDKVSSPSSVAKSEQSARIYTSSASCRLKAASAMALAGAACEY